MDLERCWGVCFFLGRGRLKLDHSERKISSSFSFKVWEGGREGGDLISQWHMVFLWFFSGPKVVWNPF